MNDPDHYLEQNTARLIESAFGPEMHPGRQSRQVLFDRLMTALREKRKSVEFPESAIGALAGIVLLMAALWATQVAPVGLSLTLALIVFCNLAAVPAAALIIVIRRRTCNSD